MWQSSWTRIASCTAAGQRAALRGSPITGFKEPRVQGPLPPEIEPAGKLLVGGRKVGDLPGRTTQPGDLACAAREQADTPDSQQRPPEQRGWASDLGQFFDDHHEPQPQ